MDLKLWSLTNAKALEAVHGEPVSLKRWKESGVAVEYADGTVGWCPFKEESASIASYYGQDLGQLAKVQAEPSFSGEGSGDVLEVQSPSADGEEDVRRPRRRRKSKG